MSASTKRGTPLKFKMSGTGMSSVLEINSLVLRGADPHEEIVARLASHLDFTPALDSPSDPFPWYGTGALADLTEAVMANEVLLPGRDKGESLNILRKARHSARCARRGRKILRKQWESKHPWTPLPDAPPPMSLAETILLLVKTVAILGVLGFALIYVSS